MSILFDTAKKDLVAHCARTPASSARSMRASAVGDRLEAGASIGTKSSDGLSLCHRYPVCANARRRLGAANRATGEAEAPISSYVKALRRSSAQTRAEGMR